jgi:hypothetical protein
MTRNLQRRLQKLESQVPRQPTEQEKNVDSLHKFLTCAVAYYLGDPTPEGSVIEAYRRALGYPNSHEFRKALHTNDPDFQEGAPSQNQTLRKIWRELRRRTGKDY